MNCCLPSDQITSTDSKTRLWWN